MYYVLQDKCAFIRYCVYSDNLKVGKGIRLIPNIKSIGILYE